MRKISILGCGWLGLPLAKKLATHYQIKGSVKRDLNVLKDTNITPFCFDIEQYPIAKIDDFLNSDTLIITIPPRPEQYIEAMLYLISQIEKSSIQNVIYCSSTSVYGKQEGTLYENTLTEPKTENAKKMVVIEQALLKNKHFKSTILRLGGLIGLKRHPAKYLSGKVLKNPNTVINLVHLVDVMGSIETILQHNLSGIYNIVAPYHPKKIDYYSQICNTLAITPPKVIAYKHLNITLINADKISTHYTFQNQKLRFNNN